VVTTSLRVVALAAIAAWSLAPFLWQVVTSLAPAAEIVTAQTLVPSRATLAHYAAALSGGSFARLMANSATVAAFATIIALAAGSLAAFALSMLRARWRAPILAAAVAVSMFPPIATLSPLFLIFSAIGLRDTLAALVVTHATFCLPLATWLLTHFFDTLPRELYVAARVDGCTAFGALWRIVLPLSAPGIVATGLLVFVFSWNEFMFALALTATEASRTVPVGIAMFPGLHEIPYGEIAAASVVVTLPIVALAFVFQRRIVDGLTAGAVKG
jgi:multiple sugar transport system permease protein